MYNSYVLVGITTVSFELTNYKSSVMTPETLSLDHLISRQKKDFHCQTI